jgi:hypothetical protein
VGADISKFNDDLCEQIHTHNRLNRVTKCITTKTKRGIVLKVKICLQWNFNFWNEIPAVERTGAEERKLHKAYVISQIATRCNFESHTTKQKYVWAASMQLVFKHHETWRLSAKRIQAQMIHKWRTHTFPEEKYIQRPMISWKKIMTSETSNLIQSIQNLSQKEAHSI